jgi:hypothetical protein
MPWLMISRLSARAVMAIHSAPNEEAKARAYNAKVLSGRHRSAVRTLTSRDQGGVLQPDDPCTKTVRPMLEVL